MLRTTISGRRQRVRWFVPAWLAMLLGVGLGTNVAQAVPAAAVEAPVVAYAGVQGHCCGGGTVVAFNASNGVVLGTVAVGGAPEGAAITPDGSRVLVTNRWGYVSAIDTVTLQQTQAPVCTWASGIAITPDGGTAVVTCSDLSSVQLIDLKDLAVTKTVAVGDNPYSVAITPDGSTAYVVNFNGSAASDYLGTVSPVTLATGATRAPIVLTGREAIGAAITPDGTRLLVGIRGNTTSGSSVDIIDTATGTVIGARSVDGAPNSVAVAPDGTTAYVASPFADAITAVPLRDGGTTERRGIGTASLAITPDQTTLLSANPSGFVDILDLPTLVTRGYSVTDPSPATVAVTPDQAPRADLRVGDQRGHRVSLDASASMSVSSPIARYAWDFGDGKGAVTTTPKVAHAYPRKGTYKVSVTLTSRAGTSTTRVFTGQTISRNGSSLARASVPVVVR